MSSRAQLTWRDVAATTFRPALRPHGQVNGRWRTLHAQQLANEARGRRVWPTRRALYCTACARA